MEWFEERRGKGVRVTGTSLKREALRLHKVHGNTNFKGTSQWFHKFKQRHNLSFRRVTLVAQKLHTKIDEKVDQFLCNTLHQRRVKSYHDRCMGNMDETSVWL